MHLTRYSLEKPGQLDPIQIFYILSSNAVTRYSMPFTTLNMQGYISVTKTPLT